MRSKFSGGVLIAALATSAVGVGAEVPEPLLNKTLNERIVFIRFGVGVELETTIFKPNGDGPFPLAVINHGKASGNPRFQARARYNVATGELVRRGYVVVIPMRGGFSRSSGKYVEGGCNIEGNANYQAKYVRTVLDYMTQQSYVDRKRIILIGQSHGGLTTMALAAEPYEGVLGVLNFAGGLRLSGSSCTDWQGSLVRAFGSFGESARIPSLWFYGANDSYFDAELAKRMHESYVSAGGKAKLMAYGPFKGDSHGTFSDRDGLKIWWPETERFLASLGLPTERLPRAAGDDPAIEALIDTTRIPHAKENCVRMYHTFLDSDYPRAYAISADGHCGYAYGGEDPQKRALANCQRLGKEQCRSYAVDNSLVWDAEP